MAEVLRGSTWRGKGNPCPPAGARSGTGVDRPPADGPPVALAPPGWQPSPEVLFVAQYSDEGYPFRNGSWGRFGRDDSQTQIPVWEQLRGAALSRVAGELWCANEEMWVRNLSSTHELAVAGRTGAPQLLAPRTVGQRGAACSVPIPDGLISAPSTGGWRITVKATAAARRLRIHSSSPDVDEGSTRTVGPVPEDLKHVAAALCAPVLLHGDPPSSYERVADILGVTSRQARRKVERLCDHYRVQVPDLLSPPAVAASGQALYAPVAQLLVARGRVSREDLAILPAGGAQPPLGADR